MQIKNVMDAIFIYLEEQNISYAQILRDTQIDISEKSTLTADEFLGLCDYLRVRPEYLKERMEDMQNDSLSL